MGWVERLREDGTEPDPRFSFANERTFLAWIRTALAMMAAGIALETFGPDFEIAWLRPALAGLLVLIGVVISGSSFRRWLNAERALRTNQPLPAPRLAPLLAYGVAVVAVASVVAVLLAR
jgi:putative membrane protein